MERQREKARAAWSGSGEAATETVWFGIKERVGATEFLGYDTETAEGMVAGAAEGRPGSRRNSRPARPASWSSTRRRSTANPAVRSAIPASCRARASRVRITGTEKKLGDLFVHHGMVEQAP